MYTKLDREVSTDDICCANSRQHAYFGQLSNSECKAAEGERHRQGQLDLLLKSMFSYGR